jgi:hypothetical protein
MLLGHDKVSKWSGWIELIIGFTWVEREHVDRKWNYPYSGKILKFSYLNLNICKVVQVFWEMMLLDIGFQYLPYTKESIELSL